ncbi:MAG: cohesin domain-containing protein [Candidatus Bathyarchaeota archaeon]|nr:cohesin domain-containing protein [Candidatus Bathyarchaeota archaeon]
MLSVSAESTAVKAQASQSQLHVGDTLTVTLKVNNAQDLYGIDVTLTWNPQVLQIQNATPMLGVESNPDGVLHESGTYPIDVEDNSQSAGQYHLLATSTGSNTPSFSGSGTIATVTFNVTSAGDAGLQLDAELAVRGSDGSVNLAEPSTSVDSVAVMVPEFPVVALVLGLLVAATATVGLATRLQKRK